MFQIHVSWNSRLFHSRSQRCLDHEICSGRVCCLSQVATAIEFVDIAGLVKGASRGEGLGNKFLSNIREVDAIVHVVRCFDDDDVVHVDGKIDASDDAEVINFELALADIGQIEKRLTKLNKSLDAAHHSCDSIGSLLL